MIIRIIRRGKYEENRVLEGLSRETNSALKYSDNKRIDIDILFCLLFSENAEVTKLSIVYLLFALLFLQLRGAEPFVGFRKAELKGQQR